MSLDPGPTTLGLALLVQVQKLRRPPRCIQYADMIIADYSELQAWSQSSPMQKN